MKNDNKHDKIPTKVRLFHHRAAASLSCLVEQLPMPVKKRLLFGICLTALLYCCALIFGTGDKVDLTGSGNISRPALPESKGVKHGVISAKDLKALQIYLQQLETTSTGRARRDSILARYPGLMDSLALIDKRINNLK